MPIISIAKLLKTISIVQSLLFTAYYITGIIVVLIVTMTFAFDIIKVGW